MEVVCNIPTKLTGNSFYLYSNISYIKTLILTSIYRLRNQFIQNIGYEPNIIHISRNIYYEFLSDINLYSLIEKNGSYFIIDSIYEVKFGLSSSMLRDLKINSFLNEKQFILADYEYKLKVKLENEY